MSPRTKIVLILYIHKLQNVYYLNTQNWSTVRQEKADISKV